MARRLIPNTPLGFRLIEHREAILRAAAHRHASNVRVFGSVARGEDRPESDIDLLVDLGPAATAFDLAVAISLDSASAGCALVGNVVSFTGAGTCVIDANQAGSVNYKAAAQVQQSVGVTSDLNGL